MVSSSTFSPLSSDIRDGDFNYDVAWYEFADSKSKFCHCNYIPGGLIEGIADYVRLKAGYAVSNWAQNGQGSRWDEGYSVTARFLDYCNGLRNGFVAELNKKMRTGYSNNFFVKLLGKTPEQLFADYKAKYKTA
ncbi:Basic secretory protease [Capsicum annuum]|uniref:Basic secretory protease n=1 Tax=Capsicum annuum TaxID=4072 RepID=A0A2G2Y2C0_CAPAN|nr:Basic secretory protease [Capsicum annuum]